jgi:hypothetical protein
LILSTKGLTKRNEVKMAVTPQMILQVRYELGDIDVSFPLLSDTEYTYFLTKNSENTAKTVLDAARVILFKLSMRSEDSTVDIFSVKGSKAAEQYRQTLILFLQNPNLNPINSNVTPYVGGISKSSVVSNDTDIDNNLIPVPVFQYLTEKNNTFSF